MLRWIGLAVVVVALTAAFTLLSFYNPEPSIGPERPVGEVSGPQPKVEIEESLVYDFGDMAQFDKGSHTWKIKNVGEGDLDLWMESSSCKCTIAKLKSPDGDKTKPKAVVKPGESETIELEWETKNSPGPFLQHATIASNDPERPLFSLSAKGNVHLPVVVYPPEMIRFDSISNEEDNWARLAVYSVDRPELKILKMTTSRPDLIVAEQAPFTDEDRKHFKNKSGGYRVGLRVKKGMPLGSFQDELTIETDHPLKPLVKVTIAIRTTGPISVVPLSVRLTDVTTKNGATRDLAMLVRDGRPTKFEVEHKPDKVEVSIEPNPTETQKGRYILRIKVPEGTLPGQVDDAIIIKTDHPNASEIKVPVNILISNVSG
jgi:Protein of unknown function (DUF1573)